jgi:hypothetical protein
VISKNLTSNKEDVKIIICVVERGYQLLLIVVAVD